MWEGQEGWGHLQQQQLGEQGLCRWLSWELRHGLESGGLVGDRNSLGRDLCSSWRCSGDTLSHLGCARGFQHEPALKSDKIPSWGWWQRHFVPAERLSCSHSTTTPGDPSFGTGICCVDSGTIPTSNPPASLRRTWWHMWHVPGACPLCHPLPGFLQGGSTAPAHPRPQQAAASSKQLGKIQGDLFAWI